MHSNFKKKNLSCANKFKFNFKLKECAGKNKILVNVIKFYIIITLSNKQIDNSGYELYVIGRLLLQIWHDGQNNSHGTMYMYTQKSLLALLK